MSGQTHDRHFIDDPLSGVSGPGNYLASGFRPDITTWAQLAAIPTADLGDKNVIIEWPDSTVGLFRTVILTAGTLATDTASGIQRPDDYNASTNAYYWAQYGNAG